MVDCNREESGFLHSRINEEGLTPSVVHAFQTLIYTYYETHKRVFPWRETDNPYHIYVSEIMLQQTQTERVLEKYTPFISTFPDFSSVACASLHKILTLWRGLGYNRRALNLKRTAEIVTTEYKGVLPDDPEVLQTFPGIGRATAGALAAFAFSNPTIFIETNIRIVFIHFFFQGQTHVKDKEIYPLVEKTLDRSNPRHWYYGLMDYGVMLKKKVKTLNKRSFHYQKQPPFEGSTRQLRGLLLKALIEKSHTESELVEGVDCDVERVKKVLQTLEKEGFITRNGDILTLG